MLEEPEQKKQKMESEGQIINEVRCKFFITRKNRNCKLIVGKSGNFCSEHEVCSESSTFDKKEGSSCRIPCPLDPKHSVFTYKLEKHLKICNAKPKDFLPVYIEKGINADPISSDETSKPVIRLIDVDTEKLKLLVDKVNELYRKYIEGTISESFQKEEKVEKEVENPIYGPQTKKHLIQTSSIIGNLREANFLQNDTAYLDFGSGKGQFSFWQATVMSNYQNSKTILIDRASHRHKQDNKIEDKNLVQRIRADISDLNLKKLDMIDECKRMIVISKHLCGVASDLAFRCIVQGNMLEKNEKSKLVEGFFIAMCCHHRSEWRNYVGKKFLLENGIDEELFQILIKMVSWAVCGTGLSREKMREGVESIEEKPNKLGLSRDDQELIGYKCKRIIDYARAKYLEDNNFKCSMMYYVNQNITLENVCLIGHHLKK